MKALILALLVVAIAAELAVTPEYTAYLKKHVSWEVVDYEENIFKGWTVEEVRTLLGDEDREVITDVAPYIATSIPSSVNWAGASCIHEIHNQGNCGSCWAFATASVASDKCCLGGKDYGWLSPQELVSCDRTNSGCNGGLASEALKYVMSKGLVPESCYPYVGAQQACPTKCKDGSDWTAAHVCKAKSLTNCGTLPAMKSCLLKGPITIRMKVYSDFFNYKSGVYCWDQKSAFQGGHAIRGVGYSDSPKAHILCANSWGPSWGESGLFRIEAREECGVRLTAGDAWSPEY